VITVQDPFESGLVGLILSVVTGLRLHVQIHTDLFSPHFVFHSLLNFVRVVISIPVILGASSVRVVSSRIANRWPSKILINQDRLAILPIFVPGFSQKIDFKASGENLSHGAIISVARLEPEKDWETAISVFAKVVKVFPEQKFFIYGSGGCGKLINSLVQSLGLSDKVVLKGWLGSQEEIYRDASILLVTSKYEGFGMVYIEAALNYVPIVSTEVGIAGIELVNERDMLTAPVADIDGLASNIIRLLKDRDLYKKIAAQAHTSVLEKFNTDEEVYLNNIVKSWSLALKN
jgi:glycosyltransferase involved in cell wall biosynthesis